MTFRLVGWVDAARRRLTWERTTDARSEARAATARAHAYGRDPDRELALDERAREVVDRARALDDGLPTTARPTSRRRAA